MKEFDLNGWISRFIMFSEARFTWVNYHFIDYLLIDRKGRPVSTCWIYWTFLIAIFKVVLFSAVWFQILYSTTFASGVLIVSALDGVNLLTHHQQLSSLASTWYQAFSLDVGVVILLGLFFLVFAIVFIVVFLFLWWAIENIIGNKLSILATRISGFFCKEVKPKY